MKQGKHYTTVILWIFIAAIAAYFGLQRGFLAHRAADHSKCH